MMKDKFGVWRDSLNLIVQSDGDGGDSPARCGQWAIATFLNLQPDIHFEENLKHYEIMSGVLVRHPSQGFAWRPPETFRNDPKEFSRDQTDPLVIAAGLYGNRAFVKRVLREQVRRWGRYQNKDVWGPATAGMYLRALRVDLAWPLLWVCDLQLLGNAPAAWWRKHRDPDFSDINNHVNRLLQASYENGTPVSWLARKLFLAMYPTWESDLRYYHRHENGGNPIIAEMVIAAIRRYWL